MERKKTVTDERSEADATFEKQPSSGDAQDLDHTTELGIQVRTNGPHDCVLELQKMLSQHGFTPAGTRPEKGFPDRERSHMIAPLKQFRRQHGLGRITAPPPPH